MVILNLIKQLTEQFSNSPLENQRISNLRPIDFVLLDIDEKVKINVEDKHSFVCLPYLKKNKDSDSILYDEIDYVKITDGKLYELLQDFDKNNIHIFIEYLNKEIFYYIQSEVEKAKNLEAWDNDNMWYKPNRRFVEWFQLKNIDPNSKMLEKEETTDALWAIADDMRARKKEGEFDTYRDAYRWAENNILKKGTPITAIRLEKAYHKAKSEGKVGIKKVSIPIMITSKMRMQLSTLGYTKDEMKHLTPSEGWEIINRGVPKKPSRERGRNQ